MRAVIVRVVSNLTRGVLCVRSGAGLFGYWPIFLRGIGCSIYAIDVFSGFNICSFFFGRPRLICISAAFPCVLVDSFVFGIVSIFKTTLLTDTATAVSTTRNFFHIRIIQLKTFPLSLLLNGGLFELLSYRTLPSFFTRHLVARDVAGWGSVS